MAYNWANLLREVMAVVATTWTDVVPNGIYLYQEIARISWEAPDAYPYAVVHLRAADTGEWGLGNVAFEPVIDFHYIMAETQAQGADPLAALNIIPAKLEALKSALYDAPHTDSQATLLDIEAMDWSGESAVNSLLLAKNVPVGGGLLSVRYVCGESAFS